MQRPASDYVQKITFSNETPVFPVRGGSLRWLRDRLHDSFGHVDLVDVVIN